jgi:hypothetical protein
MLGIVRRVIVGVESDGTGLDHKGQRDCLGKVGAGQYQ